MTGDSTTGLLFEERFDGKLAEGWSWIQQKDGAWRLDEHGLALLNRGERENTLARDVPDSKTIPFAVEMTLTSTPQPTEQYEQVGFFWYRGGEEAFKFVKERIDGELYVFPGNKSMTAETVEMRLVLQAEKFSAQYRPEGRGDFRTAFEDALPQRDGKDQVAISCFGGPQNTEHWVRIHDFRIRGLTQPEC